MGATCCAPTTPGFRMLTFPDGTQSGVFGLDEIFAAVYSESMPVSTDTAREIVERLAARNYIASSVRQRYCDLVIDEYRKYVENRASESRREKVQAPSRPAECRCRTGLLSRIFGKKK
jgi:hypothetical protein